MATELGTSPSFFKVLLTNFTDKLTLPPAFVRKFGDYLAGTAKLMTPSGESWNVEISQEIEGGKFCFAKGWNQFVKAFGLQIGEVLLFWFNSADSSFIVSVYGINGCKREYSNSSLQDFPNKPGEEINPRIEIVLTERMKFRLNLGRNFAEKLKGKKAVVVVYPPRERYWAILLEEMTFPSFSYVLMVEGWSEFREDNGLVMGKTYSFEFDANKNVIQVKQV